ncbi:nucleotide-diphosphate-sugar epimerase [Acrocarpospora phusangensis]|uniref:Nucleotide-diphosphate-sugar epimerase n=1 Tax=Acrocarpospora phusangensis TaxID=1070424 RepID=A0A919QBS7_9ACTN|nr:NAD(P)H-binding protein [Acrocarpospora phusangensis]GIH24465.1 nucleotide-diphosphate-sugar epimerase [Acrocarpospora phusangensis]
MTGSILVTGGTGVLGRRVVDRLKDGIRDVRVLSRKPGLYQGDLTTGEGLPEAVAGVDTIVHLASAPRTRGADVAGARRLLGAAAPGTHLLYISIVGVDGHPYWYYQEKFQVEQLIEASGLPYTILRATQFHELMRFIIQGMTRAPVAPYPMGWSMQPVDSGEVADRMTGLVLGAPAGRVPDMGGPEVVPLRELITTYLRATGRRRLLVPIWLPGKTAAAYREGRHLTPEHRTGVITFEEFLAATVKPGTPAYGYG